MEQEKIELIETFIESQIGGVSANYLVIGLIEEWFDSFETTRVQIRLNNNHRIGKVNKNDVYLNSKLFFDNLTIYGVNTEEELSLRDILTEEQINSLLDVT